MLLCFITGMVFWFLNALNKEYNTTIEYPIEFEYPRMGDLSVVEPLPEYIRIELKGNGWQLLSLTMDYFPKPVPVSLEKPTKIKGISTSSLSPVIRSFFNDISLVEVYPDSLHFDIQEKVKKVVKLYVDISALNFEQNYVVSSQVNIYPREVVYEGPVSYINELPDSLHVYPKEELIDSEIDENINLESTNAELISISPNTVHLSFKVGKLQELMHRVDINKVNFPELYNLEDSVAWVSFSVLSERVNALADMDFKVIADFKNMSKKDSTIFLEIVRYPRFVRNIILDTSRVRVTKKSLNE